MQARDAAFVARRCLCLEVLLQRLGLETDTDDPVTTREEVRRTWLSRLGDLELTDVFLPDERGLLERPVSDLSEDELDELHGRASGTVVLLWALGRLPERPTRATFDDMESVIAEHGILGAGSISRANETVSVLALRPEEELRGALSVYEKARGKAREPSEPEKIIAGIAAHHLEWILDRDTPTA